MVRIKIPNDIILIIFFTLILVLIIPLFPSSIIRIFIGLPFALFFPGYTLLKAVYPAKDRLDAFQTLGFSIGFSLGIVSVIVLILNFTSLGIRLYPILFTTTGFIVAAAIVALYRRKRLSNENILWIEFQVKRPEIPKNTIDRLLVLTLIVVIVISLGVLGYIAAVPKTEESFTEFYLSLPDGSAIESNITLNQGEPGQVRFYIVNREQTETSYRIEVDIEGVTVNGTDTLMLNNDMKWSGVIYFTPERAGEDQKVEFILFKQDKLDKRLYIWVDVGG